MPRPDRTASTPPVLYRVANTVEGLQTAPPVEATHEAEAAAKYVADHNLAPGTYYVLEIAEPVVISVRVRRVIEAHAVGGDNDQDVAWAEERNDG